MTAKGTEQMSVPAMDEILDRFGVPKAEAKPVEPKVSEPVAKSDSPAEDKVVSETEQTEKVAKESTDQDASAETDAPKYTERDFLARVEEESSRRAQSMKDRELKEIYAQVQTLKKEKQDLARKVEDRADEKDLKLMFDADAEEKGEDTARQAHEARQKFIARYREYKEKESQAREQLAEVETTIQRISGVEKNQRAREEALKIVFPQDKGLISQMGSIVKRLEQAETPKEFDLMLSGIRAEYQSKAQPKKQFVPDSGRSTGSGAQGKFTRQALADYTPKGKSASQMIKDADALLDQITKKR